MFDERILSILPGNGNDVVAASPVEQVVSLEPHQSRSANLLLLLSRHRLGRMASTVGRTGLYLNKHNPFAVAGNDVNFAHKVPRLPGQDFVALVAEKFRREVFTPVAEQFSQPADREHGET